MWYHKMCVLNSATCKLGHRCEGILKVDGCQTPPQNHQSISCPHLRQRLSTRPLKSPHRARPSHHLCIRDQLPRKYRHSLSWLLRQSRPALLVVVVVVALVFRSLIRGSRLCTRMRTRWHRQSTPRRSDTGSRHTRPNRCEVVRAEGSHILLLRAVMTRPPGQWRTWCKAAGSWP